ncbi:TM2 domain-containing membrane protein YozV [Arthrobacter silviterrae]|uniref:NINE protein n=1 Tax=Arthrobacter silviterrae TaxID=2026658 RepID=UPI002785F070|nr:NINE protein [Arthrobacter silviterrae]MDQ0276690.1 TM2 domain-containing membrane protein YozV [Arthrobacter silviterrae]
MEGPELVQLSNRLCNYRLAKWHFELKSSPNVCAAKLRDFLRHFAHWRNDKLEAGGPPDFFATVYTFKDYIIKGKIMGKMKGNRLNTAANVGSFVTGRQQLKFQEQIAANTSAMLALQQQQAARADHDRLVAELDMAVACGRMTVEQANAHMELTIYNQQHPAPHPKTRVVPTASAAVDGFLRIGGVPAGWYKQDGLSARYWDGQRWTLNTMQLIRAKQVVKQQWLATPAIGNQKSRRIAGLLGIFLGMFGIHRFYLGHTGIGVLQASAFVLLFAATYGLIVLWGVIEGVMIISDAKAFKRDAHGIPLA